MAAAAAAGTAAAATSSGDDDDDCVACPCSNIVIMQLFHELKQQYPAVPDRIVSECIRQNRHDKPTCEALLRREHHGYLMHCSYPTALKMTTTVEDGGGGVPAAATLPGSPPPPTGGDRCGGVTKHRGDQVEFYSASVTERVVANTAGNHVTRSSAVRDEVITTTGVDVVLPPSSGVNMNDSRCYNPAGVTTGTQWYAQGSTRYLPGNHSHNIPIGESNVRYNQTPRSVLGNSGGQFVTQCDRQQQYQDVTITQRGTSSVQCVENQSTTNSSQYYASVDSNSNPSCVVGGGEKDDRRLQQQQQQTVAASPAVSQCRAVASRSSVSVHSSTTYHKHCNRPCSLNVSPAGVPDKGHPRSAPELPHTFLPFSGVRATEFPTPSTPTTPSDHYYGGVHSYDTCSSMSNLSENTSENNLNFPRGRTRDNVHQEYAMNVNCSVGASAGATAGGIAGATAACGDAYHRARSAVTVEPAPHYSSRNCWGGGAGTVAIPSAQQSRSYTSVNLTLRPPSLEPLPPIEIASAGTSLTYSTSSYDPRQGYQSQLQICIGPGGVGSVSALRTRAPEVRARSCYAPAGKDVNSMLRTESMPDVGALSLVSEDLSLEGSLRDTFAGSAQHAQTKALLMQQIERKNRLRRELKREKQKLRDMHREVQGMAADLAQRQCRQRAANIALPVVTTVLQRVQSLRQEIQFLQKECKKMTTEVDLSSGDRVPLGETDEAFYKNIYTGQRGRVLNSLHPTVNNTAQSRDMPGHPTPTSPLEVLDLDGPNWTCSECTFRNHPLLDKCEQCEMPRIILGTDTQPRHPVDCYCHSTNTSDKMFLPDPLIPLPRMITNSENNLERD